MIHQGERFDGEHSRYVLIVNGQQVVTVGLFAAKRKVGGATIDHRIFSVESTHHKFVMHLMAQPNAGNLVERRRQFCSGGLAGNQHPGLPAARVERDAVRCVGDSIAKNVLVGVDLAQCRENRPCAFLVQAHHREQDAALRSSFLLRCASRDRRVSSRQKPPDAARR